MTFIADLALIAAAWYLLAPLAVWRIVRLPAGQNAVAEVGQLGDSAAWSQLATLSNSLPRAFANCPPSFLLISGCPAIASFDHETSVVALAGTPANGKAYLEFNTRFTDGRELMTNNSATLVGLFVTPNLVRQYPEIHTPDDLFKAHLALVRHDGRTPSDRVPEEVVHNIKIENARSLERQVASGYFRRDGEFLRLTLIGAYRAAFMQLHPFLWIRRSRRRADDRATLARAKGA
jgi:hypothetical protein